MGHDPPDDGNAPANVQDLAAMHVAQGPAGLVITLTGEIDMSNAQDLRARIVTVAATAPADPAAPVEPAQSADHDELAQQAPSVVLDLTRLRFIDSSAISALVQLAAQFTDAGRPLMLVAAYDSTAARTLRLAGLDEALHLQEPSAALGVPAEPDRPDGDRR